MSSKSKQSARPHNNYPHSQPHHHQNHQPTKFTVYPCSPSRKLKHSPDQPPHTSDNHSLPAKPHCHSNQLPWRPISYGDLHHPKPERVVHAKPTVPPRTSSIHGHKPPALPPKGPRLQTFCADTEPSYRGPMPPQELSAGSRNSLDCVSDDGTTTSGSYVVDLAEVEEADDMEVSDDVVV